MLISLVIPAFNEENQLPITAEEIPKHLPAGIDAEIIFVDDGSSDNSFAVIKSLARKADELKADLNSYKIKGVSFTRNFGKETAVRAGLRQAAGDAVIIMDCDLQHPPRYLPEMIKHWQEDGCEIVEGIRKREADESFFYRSAAASFYAVFSFLTGITFKNLSDFQLLDRRAVDAVNKLNEHDSFFRGLSKFVGYKRCNFEFEVDERTVGASKWSKSGLAKMALDSMLAFSYRPLRIFFFTASTIFALFLLYAFIALICRIFSLSAFPLTIADFFNYSMLNMIFLSLTLIGLYVGRVYEEVKSRPIFLIKEIYDIDAAENKSGEQKLKAETPGE